MIFAAAAMSAAALAAAGASNVAAAPLERALRAADRSEIVELGARFDNALDAENEARFVSTFTQEGVLAGFWGEAKGPEQIAGAYRFMLSTFAKNRRHFVGNHEVEIDGDRARMFSYMVVLDRATNSSIGTATFTDELVRKDGAWKFARRTLAADANVQPIIDQLRAAH
ncbi:MAG: nuclear transport factor 2 family protein [Parvularculaceae bacterium]|nr:nuclear transport factor 2 family protein [Parvularculaceae bacterium]